MDLKINYWLDGGKCEILKVQGENGGRKLKVQGENGGRKLKVQGENVKIWWARN